MEDEDIAAWDGVIDVAFYYSKHNPTTVVWSTTLCTPCANISSEYLYKYSESGLPATATYVRDNYIEEIINYYY